MKRINLAFLLVMLALVAQAQAPHLYDHTYPVIHEEQPQIRALINQVSKDSLEATIARMQSFPTRRWDSRMVYEVQDWLYDTYNAMGFDTVLLHDFQFVWHDTLRETSDNVIAIQRGVLYPDEYVVCGAHYDSYNNSPGHPDSLLAPGADDNASGSSGIIETARLLSRCTFERSILYCGWAAEEIGLKGSEAFANDCAEQRLDIVGYFNLDMTGYLEEGSDLHVNLMYTTQDSLIADYVFNLSHVYFPDMPIWQDWLAWGDSDYSSFNRCGYPAVHPFEDVHHSSPFIHSVDDLLGVSVNNMDQVQRFTELNLGLVATLAGLVSTSVDEASTGDLVVYPNPVSGLLTVKGPAMQQIEIYDLFGQQVKKETCHGSEVLLDLTSLAAGVYVLRVTDDAMQVHSHRVVTY
ncbi:MAG: M20/M25/M40 family metallo-hydrolase [Bacteroidales bacterium]|nr:M20/M25/M40 family metallo-hydrolase [Bacteroidales bacterium]